MTKKFAPRHQLIVRIDKTLWNKFKKLQANLAKRGLKADTNMMFAKAIEDMIEEYKLEESK